MCHTVQPSLPVCTNYRSTPETLALWLGAANRGMNTSWFLKLHYYIFFESLVLFKSSAFFGSLTKILLFMSIFLSYLLGVLRSIALLNMLCKSTPTDLHVSWESVTGWVVGVKPGFPVEEEEEAVSAALSAALLGGEALGRRSGGPDGMTAGRGRKNC